MLKEDKNQLKFIQIVFTSEWFPQKKKLDKELGDMIELPKTFLTQILLVAQNIKHLLQAIFKKPVSHWPLKKRIQQAMNNFEKLSGYSFDINHPTLYTEKRVWYQLFYDHPDFTRISDKYLFKEYIKEKLGTDYTAPLYGVWTNIGDLNKDWERLPKSFCLKSNCSSLGRNTLFITNKEEVDKNELYATVKEWLNPMNTSINSCNRAYYKVKPRIIAEKLLESKLDQLYDYKVMCFNGKAEFFIGTANRFPKEKNRLSCSYYDLSLRSKKTPASNALR